MLPPTAWRVLRTVVPVLVLSMLAAPWRAPAPAAAAPSLQAPVAATGIRTSMHDNVLTWRTTPSTVVQAQLREGTAVRANAQPAVSDAQGFVRIQFGGGGGGGGMGGANRGPYVQSGYTVALTPQGAAEQTAAVPDLAAAIDVDGDRVVGRAPAGSSVAVSLEAGPGVTAPMTNTVTAAADGSFSTTFAGHDLKAGHGGRAALTTADGNTFDARFVAIEASASIGARGASGSATPGERVNVAFSAPDGAARGRGAVTVRPGVNWNVAAGGGGGGGGGGGPNALQVLRAGDTVSITVASGLPGGTRTLRGVAPAVSIDQVSAGDRRVVGRAPAGLALSVEAISPLGGTPATASTTSAADGTFTVTMPGSDPIGPGWRIRVGAEVAPGLWIWSVDAIEQVRVGVHTGQVTGVADPGTLVTVTLRAANGTEKAVDDDRANNAGTYGVAFGGANGIAIGDRVEVTFVAGDPVIVPVGNVTAQTDKAADRVSGEAPAGTVVTVSRQQGGQTTRKSVTADASGRYIADFAGILDITDPMAGEVAVRLLSGHELVSSWAAVRMALEINDTFVSGNGPSGRTAAIALVDRNGVVVASGQANIGGGGGGGGFGPGGGGFGGNWLINLTDTTDQPVRIQVGDTVRATVGDDVFNLVVPELRGAAFVADDLVNGVTAAGKVVGIDVVRPLVGDDAEAEATADANGNFSHTFSGTFDLQHNDSITFNIDEAGHTILSQIFVPGLRLNLDTGVLVGSWRPVADVAITVLSGGRTIYSGQAKTDIDAIFTVTMAGEGGARIRPQTGDVVRVVPAGAPAETLELTVPELSVAFDEEGNAVSGRATPGGHLELNVGDAIARPILGGGPGGGGGFGGNRNAEPTINADGTWRQTFQPPYNVQPGTGANLIYRVPIGHRVSMQRYVPILVAQHGGSHACGLVGAPRDAVTADLNDAAGAALGHAEGLAGYNSQFDFELAKAGVPVVTAAGQVVKAKLGSKDVTVTLPAIAVSVNWTTGQLTGTVPANTIVMRRFPAGGCLDLGGGGPGGGPGGGGAGVQAVRSNAQGVFQFPPLPGFQRDPGDGFEIGVFNDDGHYVFRHAYRARGEVYVHTDRVAGQALPSSPVIVVVKAADGTERGRIAGATDAGGRFDVRVKDGAGRPLSIEPGMTVHLDASGDLADIAVEELDFDWSPGAGNALRGNTTPDRQVRIYLRLRDGRTIAFDRGSDTAGAFGFAAADVPPRADWSMADVVGIRVETDTPNRHLLVAEAGDAVGPVPTPTPPPAAGGNRIYLPFGQRYRRP